MRSATRARVPICLRHYVRMFVTNMSRRTLEDMKNCEACIVRGIDNRPKGAA